MYKFDIIEKAILGKIQKSVYGYTLNSWYNHWSSVMLEEIFNSHIKVFPTIDKIKNIDFFVDTIPFDLKATYFPEELMAASIENKLNQLYGSKNELTCLKKIAKKINISIPTDLTKRALTICLENLIRESDNSLAQDYLYQITKIKKDVISYFKNNPNELIIWLYENQGEMRFDASNRFYVVLVDSNNFYESWKLKRNKNFLVADVNKKLDAFTKTKVNKISFTWPKNNTNYICYSELLFIIK